MTKELSEDSKFQISIKTLIAIVVTVATVISLAILSLKFSFVANVWPKVVPQANINNIINIYR